MNAVSELNVMGVSVSVVDGAVKLQGLAALDKARAQAAIALARAQKEAILAELEVKAPHVLTDTQADHAGSRRVPSRIPAQAWRNYRAGVAWIRPKLPELLRQGWTGKTLFRIGKLTHPFGWGVAWAWSTKPGWVPELADGGIRWTVEEHNRTVELWDRPTAGGGR